MAWVENNDEVGGGQVWVPDNPAPNAPNAIDTEIQSFIDLLRGGESGGAQQRFFDAAGRLDAIARGEGDPAFQFEESRALGGVQEQFSRSGMGMSAAALNAQNRTRQQFGSMRLQRQDAAQEMSLNALSAGVETAATPAELLISQLAAERSGQGGGGMCCFIFLEARYGTGVLDRVVRRFRDEHLTARNRRGYYKLAEVLVPLMRRWRPVRWAVRVALTDPLVAYGRWYYGENRWGWVFAPAKRFWLDLFDYLGGEHPFLRENGEVV